MQWQSIRNNDFAEFQQQQGLSEASSCLCRWVITGHWSFRRHLCQLVSANVQSCMLSISTSSKWFQMTYESSKIKHDRTLQISLRKKILKNTSFQSYWDNIGEHDPNYSTVQDLTFGPRHTSYWSRGCFQCELSESDDHPTDAATKRRQWDAEGGRNERGLEVDYAKVCANVASTERWQVDESAVS